MPTPPPPDPATHVTAAIDELLRSVTHLVASVRGAISGSREVKYAAKDVQRAATSTGKKIASKVKAAWARMSPAERKARVEKMHAWRKKGKRKGKKS